MKKNLLGKGEWAVKGANEAEKKPGKGKRAALLGVPLAFLLLAAAIALFLFLPPARGKAEPLELPRHAIGTWRFAVLSDSLLGENAQREQTARTALNIARQQNASLLLFAGNLSNGSRDGMNTYNTLYGQVFGERSAQPPTLAAMGAADLRGATSALQQRLFADAMEHSPSTHAIVEGLHFIVLSADRTDSKKPYSAAALRWLENALQAAAKDKPIFVLSAYPPAGSVYGSEEFGVQALADAFKKYPNVISVSGTACRPQLDERTLYQGDYTAIASQGLAEIQLETGFETLPAGGTPSGAGEQPFVLVFTVDKIAVTVDRWNVEERLLERADKPWKLSLPLQKETFAYTAERRQTENANHPPYFKTADLTGSTSIPGAQGKILDGVVFSAAQDDNDRVAYYEMQTVNWLGVAATYRFAADTYLGERRQAARITLPLEATLPSGDYQVKITAVDSFGARSKGTQSGKITHTQTEMAP
jgi:hypothetical protein